MKHFGWKIRQFVCKIRHFVILETRDVARKAYETTKYRFLIGKADVNSLGLGLERQDNANMNYLEAVRAYWKYYYSIRWLTLVDFELNKNLSEGLDKKWE